MMNTQRFQSVVEEINQITGLSISLYGEGGNLLASVGEIPPAIAERIASFLQSEASYLDQEMDHFLLVEVEDEARYVLLLSGDGYQPVIGQMAAAQIRNLAMTMVETYDRSNFMQNILLGNMLPVDLMSKAKKLHIEQTRRVVFLIDTASKSNEFVRETVKNLANFKSKDFVLRMDENYVILVRALETGKSEEEEDAELSGMASLLVDTIQMEAMVRVRVAYGNPVDQLIDLSKSYQEATMALNVAKVFYAEQETISYGRLGIGRLIYQLPLSLCEMFIKEVFGDTIPDILEDEEAMNTISKFLENSLNISETARQLYLHRNTLVYRLERIEKAVGLDIRNFEEAMLFRIAVMVLAHMKASKQ